MGLFRLQLLRAEHNTAERNVRGLAARENLGPGSDLAALLPFENIINFVEKADEKQGAGSKRALGIWRAFPSAIHRSRKWLVAFEAWNLFLIAVSLVGFNYVKLWASSPWTFWGVWLAAIGTVVVTGYSVYAWTIGEDDGGLWKRLLSRAGVSSTDWIMALATVGILVAAIITAVWQGVWIRRQWYTMEGQLVAANNALALTRQSNEHAYRAWLTVQGLNGPFLAVVGGSPEVNVTVENTGRSPAQRIQFFPVTAVQLPNWVPPDPLPRTSGERGISVLGPGQHRDLTFTRTARFSRDEIDAILARRVTLFYVGLVTYEDQFGKDRGLKFCLRYEPPADGNPVKYMLSCPGYDAVW